MVLNFISVALQYILGGGSMLQILKIKLTHISKWEQIVQDTCKILHTRNEVQSKVK